MDQNTEEWIAARVGKVTSSRFSAVVSKGVGDKASKTARAYMLQLIGERLTGLPSEGFTSKQTDWGHKHEETARALYSWQMSCAVQKCGFIEHPIVKGSGGSPDSLVGDDGILEIKCPYNSSVHLTTLLFGEIDDDYHWQMQGNLWVTGREWCDFVSHDPRMPVGSELVILRYARDEDMIREINSRVPQFIEQIDIKVAKIRNNQKDSK